jgi:hypothetical protein
MKIIIIAISAALVFLGAGCTTQTANKSYEMAAAGKMEMTYPYAASKDQIRQAAFMALVEGKYNVVREGDNLRATLSQGGVDAKLLLSFENNAMHINAKGSNVDGKPIMPLRFIDYVNKRTQKNLANYR